MWAVLLGSHRHLRTTAESTNQDKSWPFECYSWRLGFWVPLPTLSVTHKIAHVNQRDNMTLSINNGYRCLTRGQQLSHLGGQWSYSLLTADVTAIRIWSYSLLDGYAIFSVYWIFGNRSSILKFLPGKQSRYFSVVEMSNEEIIVGKKEVQSGN